MHVNWLHLSSEIVCWLLIHPYAPAYSLFGISAVLFLTDYVRTER